VFSSVSESHFFNHRALKAFLRLHFANPLLCLTVSITLREKPLALNQSKHPLASYLSAKSPLPSTPDSSSPTSPDRPTEEDLQKEDELGLEEINLLEGLSTSTFLWVIIVLTKTPFQVLPSPQVLIVLFSRLIGSAILSADKCSQSPPPPLLPP
jgi:hypothetical protein